MWAVALGGGGPTTGSGAASRPTVLQLDGNAGLSTQDGRSILSARRPSLSRVRTPVVLALAALLIGAVSCNANSGQGGASPSKPRATTTVPVIAGSGSASKPSAGPGALAVSNASATSIQPQPAPGSCQKSSATVYSLPDRRCTPGALNPAVTQATLDGTICKSGYSRTIRPSSSVTGPEKLASMRAYGDPDQPASYEYDHLISLELGGAANDDRNLWPEPGGSPNPKDRLENRLHSLVCNRQLALASAQNEIATNWIGSYQQAFGTSPADPAPTRSALAPMPTQRGTGPSCSAAVSNAHPGPGGHETVTVHTTANATVRTAEHYKSKTSEHDGTANSSGVASITFSIGGPSAGYTVHVSVTTSSRQSCGTAFTPA
jgi:hypothetical protein